MSKLFCIKGSLEGKKFEITQKIMVIGRSAENDIAAEDQGISRKHAKVYKRDDMFFIEDLGSRNGVQINGKQVEKSALRDNDVIRIGALAFKFKTEDSQSQSSGSLKTRTIREAAKSEFSIEDIATVEKVKDARSKIEAEIGKIIIGQKEVVEQLLTCLFARGNLLLEGVPGLAKTLMIATLADILDLEFKRIQFTPDLMPSDITGTDILQENPETKKREFKFIRGPIFTNVLLADEINRTPPKTQAALLEAMQEYRVTAAGITYDIELPFFVLATQNPLEQEGTYPLPEAQMDRFMFKVNIDYPTRAEEIEIALQTTKDKDSQLSKVFTAEDILALQNLVRKIPVSEHVVSYCADLVRATRPGLPGTPAFVNEWLKWGAGPRATQYLVLGGKARAVLNGRVNVSVEDVKAVAPQVLRHRMFCNFNATSEGISVDDVVTKLLDSIHPNQL